MLVGVRQVYDKVLSIAERVRACSADACLGWSRYRHSILFSKRYDMLECSEVVTREYRYRHREPPASLFEAGVAAGESRAASQVAYLFAGGGTSRER